MAKLTMKGPLCPIPDDSSSSRRSSSSSTLLPSNTLATDTTSKVRSSFLGRSSHGHSRKSNHGKSTLLSTSSHHSTNSSSSNTHHNRGLTLECQKCHQWLDPKAFARPQRMKAMLAIAEGREVIDVSCRTCVWKSLSTTTPSNNPVLLSKTTSKSSHPFHNSIDTNPIDKKAVQKSNELPHHRRPTQTTTTTATTICTGSSSFSSMSSLASLACWSPTVSMNYHFPVVTQQEDSEHNLSISSFAEAVDTISPTPTTPTIEGTTRTTRTAIARQFEESSTTIFA